MSTSPSRTNAPTLIPRINPLTIATLSVQAVANPDKWFYPVCVISYNQDDEILALKIFRYTESGDLAVESVPEFRTYYAHQASMEICCLCNLEAPALLVLRRIDEEFALSRAPGTATAHRPNCTYALDSSRGTAPAPPESNTAERIWTIRPASIKRYLGDGNAVRRRNAEEKIRPPRRPRGYSVSRPALVTLVYRLKHSAKTNQYDPTAGALDYTSLMTTLANESKNHPTTSGMLREYMLFAGHDSNYDLIDTLEARAGNTRANRVLLFGRTVNIVANDTDLHTISLEGIDRPIPISSATLQAGQEKSVFKSKTLFADLDNPNLRVMAILAVGLDQNGNPIATEASFFVTSPEWIPVESSHELRMTDHLVSMGHHFTKPLVEDKRWRYRHDFILHLSTGDYPIEVNGMSRSEAYCAHKGVVRDHLTANYPDHHSCWWPELSKEIPWLPCPSRKNTFCEPTTPDT